MCGGKWCSSHVVQISAEAGSLPCKKMKHDSLACHCQCAGCSRAGALGLESLQGDGLRRPNLKQGRRAVGGLLCAAWQLDLLVWPDGAKIER